MFFIIEKLYQRPGNLFQTTFWCLLHIFCYTFIRENYAEIMIGKHDFEVGNRDFKSQFGAIFFV